MFTGVVDAYMVPDSHQYPGNPRFSQWTDPLPRQNSGMTVVIQRADYGDPALELFLGAHLADIAPTAPSESQHALDYETMKSTRDFRLWVARIDGELVGTIGLGCLSSEHEEIKSMRTAPDYRGRGIGKLLLDHAICDATSRGVHQLSLETGSMKFFHTARALYQRAGFAVCAAFGDYPTDDPNSIFMTLRLQQ